MNAHRLVVRLALVTALLLGGCASRQGGFVAEPTTADAEPSAPVTFLWAANGGAQSGDIEAIFPDGESFTGTYREIHDTTYPESVQDFYARWYDGWKGSLVAGWPDLEVHDYLRAYDDAAVALLDGAHGHRLRCEFVLAQPSKGMRGGGHGRCQRSDGREVDARFDPVPRT